MPVPYVKPYLNLDDQIALLQERGMRISDTDKAKSFLQRIGYYRLSGYWYPLRQSRLETVNGKIVTTILDDFRTGVEFRHAVDLYVFDKKLRLLFSDALERIEVAVRVDIASILGRHDTFAHRNPNLLHGNFTKKIDRFTGNTFYADWLARFDQLAARSKEDFVTHFKQKYSSPLPIWVGTELWDYGLLSRFLGGMSHADLMVVANKYNLPRHDLVPSWIRSMNHIRNICAHHSRLWNRSPADQPRIPQTNEVALLNHFVSDQFAQTHLYGVAVVMQYMLKIINPASNWSSRLKEHLSTFPTAPGIDIRQTGFPEGWQNLPLWISPEDNHSL